MSIPRGEAMGWTTVKKIFAESGQLLNQELEVRGWIRTQRESKNFTFIELND
jgi:asparaginyl-tRNA synthetase